MSQSYNPQRFRLAREYRGFTIKELAEEVDLSWRSVAGYESDRVPPEKTLQKLAKALGFPVAFFFRENPPEIPEGAVSFRAYSRMKGSLRRKALKASALGVEIFLWLEKRLKLPPVFLPDFEGAKPEVAAAALRETWRLGEKPIKTLLALLESKGVRILAFPQPSEDLDAFSFWYNGIPYIFLNISKGVERLRFDLAHELGHLVLHRRSSLRGQQVEAEAHAFAAEFLMPRASVLAHLHRFPSLETILKLKKMWGVSFAALLKRVYDLGLLSEWRYRSLWIEANRQGWRTREPRPLPSGTERSLLWTKVLKVLPETGYRLSHLCRDLALPPIEVNAFLRGLTLALVKA